jgi:hypothetical protein
MFRGTPIKLCFKSHLALSLVPNPNSLCLVRHVGNIDRVTGKTSGVPLDVPQFATLVVLTTTKTQNL